ncbi:hypothetical protein DdX_10889 [Ditylenchus destructor]|uniref:Uncharacterized protein n=1 Tax=Ditylenchus destructor TaxID=166010 RepID=A0AAD4N1A4_9BILA|nr:hypothetical protein DdX_10889 [Ditylenchus destructor]
MAVGPRTIFLQCSNTTVHNRKKEVVCVRLTTATVIFPLPIVCVSLPCRSNRNRNPFLGWNLVHSSSPATVPFDSARGMHRHHRRLNFSSFSSQIS